MTKKFLTSLAAGAGIGAISGLGLYFALQSGFDDLDKAVDELEQSLQEIGVSSEELLEATEELTRTLDEETKAIDSLTQTFSPPAQVVDLCNNTFWRKYNLCENLFLSDGTVLSIERNKASKHLIEGIDDLRSGKTQSAFEAPLPAEEADQILLYDSLG